MTQNELTIPEVTAQIFDTIMQNVGLSEHHIVFDAKRVLEQECDSGNGIIVMKLDNGLVVRLSIQEHREDYFEDSELLDSYIESVDLPQD